MADIAASSAAARASGRNSLHKVMQRKSTIAFLMALPLILLIAILVAYPAGYAIWLSMLNKSMTKFVGFGNFDFLFKRATFWEIVLQSVICFQRCEVSYAYGRYSARPLVWLISIRTVIVSPRSPGTNRGR